MNDMKITSLLVEHGSKPGLASVTIKAEVPAKMAGEMTYDMLGVLSVLAAPAITKTEEAKAEAEERPTSRSGATASTEPSAVSTRRRASSSSAAASSAEAPGSTEATEATVSPAEAASPSEAPAPLGRRRVAPLPAAESAPAASSPEPQAPAAAAPAAAGPAPNRRRTAASSAAAPATTEQTAPAAGASPSYSNADMTKAASDAAEKIGPNAVKEAIAMFGVLHVGQLDEQQRPAFLTELRNRMAA